MHNPASEKYILMDPNTPLQDYPTNDGIPSIDWLVEGVIARGERVLIFGEAGHFKSFIVLHLALHLAKGHKWLGEYAIPSPQRVLYIDEEMHEDTLRRRLLQLGRGAGIEPPLPFKYYSQPGIRLTGDSADFLLGVLRTQHNWVPNVVILETLREVMKGDENKAQEVRAFWQACEPFRKAGMTVIVTHHMNKPPLEGNRSPRHRASGSTDIIAGSDSAWALTRPDNKGNKTILEAVRVRTVEEAEPIHIELAFNGETGPISVTKGIRDTHPQTDLAVKILVRTLEMVESAETSMLEELCAAEEISRRTFFRALQLLERIGQIRQTKHGYWAIVP